MCKKRQISFGTCTHGWIWFWNLKSWKVIYVLLNTQEQTRFIWDCSLKINYKMYFKKDEQDRTVVDDWEMGSILTSVDTTNNIALGA